MDEMIDFIFNIFFIDYHNIMDNKKYLLRVFPKKFI